MASQPESAAEMPDGHAGDDGDARAVLLAVFVSIAAVGSEPLSELLPYALYLPLVAMFMLSSERAMVPALRRLLRVLPLLALLALGLPLSRVLDSALSGAAQADSEALWLPALSLFLRAFCAVALVSALVHGYGFSRILTALRKAGMPVAVLLTLEHMERYRGLIAEEWRRTNLARESRSPGGARFAFGSYANQAGLVFLRSWERSERVHAAMLARGFRFDPKARVPAAPAPSAFWSSMLRVIWLPVSALAIRLAV